MAIPAEKTDNANSLLEKLNIAAFGRSRLESIRNDICARCGGSAEEFDDEISKIEFTMSGFCQCCQNIAFAPPIGDIP